MKGAKKIFVAASLLLLGACGGPKIIPDGELAQIFHDIYLVNAYIGQNGIRIDSLNIYEPVFASHGYTSEDIQYTIGNFAKRKSARLSDDVVEVAADMLRRESRFYRRRIEIRDTVALVAKEKYARTVYSDSLIRVRRIADTARLRIVIPDVEKGTYEVVYNYFLDSLDRNPAPRVNVLLVDENGGQTSAGSRRLDHARRSEIRTTITAADNHRTLVLALNGYSEDITTPNLTIDSLRVTYYLPEEIALERLARSRYGRTALDALLDSLSESHETHLVPPFADSAGTSVR